MLTYQVTQHDGRSGLRLSGELTIYTAGQARQDIPSQLAASGACELDLFGIEELDTAGVQLLFWLKREAASRGSQLAFAYHSPAVLDVLDLMNLTAAFGDTILLPPSSSLGSQS
jgi:anti-sigma B factor antagonist